MYLEKELEILEEYKDFGVDYLKNKLFPTLKSKVFEPRFLNPKIPFHWKNNNCESMNFKFKLLGDWRLSKLPQLVQLIQEIHDNQLLNIRGAIHGRGNFELANSSKHLFVFHTAWVAMSEQQRSKCLLKFIKHFDNSDFQISGDGNLKIPTTSKIAKKPGQIKRVRNAKTTSWPNKKTKTEKDTGE